MIVPFSVATVLLMPVAGSVVTTGGTGLMTTVRVLVAMLPELSVAV